MIGEWVRPVEKRLYRERAGGESEWEELPTERLLNTTSVRAGDKQRHRCTVAAVLESAGGSCRAIKRAESAESATGATADTSHNMDTYVRHT